MLAPVQDDIERRRTDLQKGQDERSPPAVAAGDIPIPAEHARVCDLSKLVPVEVDALLAATEVGEIWGVGRRIGAALVEGGVATALDLARLDPATVKRRWSVVLKRKVRELQGTPCIGLEDHPEPKKQDRLHQVVWKACGGL